MYFLLIPGDRDTYPTLELVTDYSNNFWVRGEPFQEDVPILEFQFDPAEREMTWLDFLRPAANIPLVSPRLREALVTAGIDNIDYYPAEIHAVGSNEIHHYFAANVIGVLEAVNRGQSEFDAFSDSDLLISNFYALSIDEAKPKGARLFRLAESRRIIIADQQIRDTVTAGAFTGIEFIEPESWDCFAA